MSQYKWVNLFPIGQSEGLVYFRAYVNSATNETAGWITRTGAVEPYVYNVFYLSTDGVVQSQTRGTWQHAAWAVQGAVG